jgi:hypothetical protein
LLLWLGHHLAKCLPVQKVGASAGTWLPAAEPLDSWQQIAEPSSNCIGVDPSDRLPKAWNAAVPEVGIEPVVGVVVPEGTFGWTQIVAAAVLGVLAADEWQTFAPV